MAKRSAQRHPASPASALVIAAAEIAKDKVLVGVRGVDGRTVRKEFPNTAGGHAGALRWWRQRAHGAPLRVCLSRRALTASTSRCCLVRSRRASCRFLASAC